MIPGLSSLKSADAVMQLTTPCANLRSQEGKWAFGTIYFEDNNPLASGTPLPPPFWNQRVRRKFQPGSLILKDLYIKSLKNKDLAAGRSLVVTNDTDSLQLRVFKERRLVGLGPLRGASW